MEESNYNFLQPRSTVQNNHSGHSHDKPGASPGVESSNAFYGIDKTIIIVILTVILVIFLIYFAYMNFFNKKPEVDPGPPKHKTPYLIDGVPPGHNRFDPINRDRFDPNFVNRNRFDGAPPGHNRFDPNLQYSQNGIPSDPRRSYTQEQSRPGNEQQSLSKVRDQLRAKNMQTPGRNQNQNDGITSGPELQDETENPNNNSRVQDITDTPDPVIQTDHSKIVETTSLSHLENIMKAV